MSITSGYCKCGPFRVSIVPHGLLKPYILRLISKRPMYGFEIMEQIFEKTGGMWRPGPAATYTTLEWLERNGYIKALDSENRSEKQRKQYGITEKGSAALTDYIDASKMIANRMKRFGSLYEDL
jgi:DNA-binding PadR family transcriptional regulator